MGDAIRIDAASETCPAGIVEQFERAMAGYEGDFETREARALQLSNELVRRWIEGELRAMAAQLGDEVVVDGQRYRRHDAGTVRYHSLCGAVAVRRHSYRRVGVHNGPTVVPLELRAGIVENATPALAFSVTQGFAERPLRHYEVELAAAHRELPSRSTLERIGKRIGARLVATIEDVEPAIRAEEVSIEGVCSISIGLDRTTVPMAEAIPGAPTGEPRVRRRPPPVEVAYRMAYVGTVSLHDASGTVLVTKRFAATPSEGADELVDRIAAELIHQRVRYGDVPICVVQDGAPELWNLTEGMRIRYAIPIAHEMIDRFHVDERIAEVCELATRYPPTARELREAWRCQLDRSDTAIDRIIRRLDQLVWHVQLGQTDGARTPTFWRSRNRFSIPPADLSTINSHLEYLRNHRQRLRYATSRRCGLPIGSGATEGACKSVVTMRFKRSGQRWFESGLAPCLSLRALHLSDRLRPCFAKLQASRFASLEAA